MPAIMFCPKCGDVKACAQKTKPVRQRDGRIEIRRVNECKGCGTHYSSPPKRGPKAPADQLDLLPRGVR